MKAIRGVIDPPLSIPLARSLLYSFARNYGYIGGYAAKQLGENKEVWRVQ